MTEQKDYKYYTDLGISQTNAKDYADAINSFDKAIELNPDYALAYFSKAIVFHMQYEKNFLY